VWHKIVVQFMMDFVWLDIGFCRLKFIRLLFCLRGI
jgi:hypothetical protein